MIHYQCRNSFFHSAPLCPLSFETNKWSPLSVGAAEVELQAERERQRLLLAHTCFTPTSLLAVTRHPSGVNEAWSRRSSCVTAPCPCPTQGTQTPYLTAPLSFPLPSPPIAPLVTENHDEAALTWNNAKALNLHNANIWDIGLSAHFFSNYNAHMLFITMVPVLCLDQCNYKLTASASKTSSLSVLQMESNPNTHSQRKLLARRSRFTIVHVTPLDILRDKRVPWASLSSNICIICFPSLTSELLLTHLGYWNEKISTRHQV